MNHLLLMMGGSGKRFGADIPKQFVEVEGQPVFTYIVQKYDSFQKADSIVVVCHSDWLDFANEKMEKLNLSKPYVVIEGGSTRSESVRNGLRKLRSSASPSDIVMIHDATHPYLDEDATIKAIEATKKYKAATLGQKQYDTVYRMNDEGELIEVVPREQIVSGASPELFEFSFIDSVYENTLDEELANFTSAGAIALANGITMFVVPTDLVNLKITHRHDMELFQKLFHGYYFKENECTRPF